MAKNMLVIDDEESICRAFQRFFERRGWRVQTACSAAQGISRFSSSRPQVVFLDIRLPDGDGLEVLQKLRAGDPTVPVIMITAYGGLKAVVGSLEGEAFDYLPKPIDLDQAEQLVARAIEPARAVATGGRRAASDGVELLGTSPAMQSVFKRIAVLARSDCSVLVLGSTGTGKEVVSRAIHHHSRRKSRPFVAVNCGAIPANLVESELFGHVRGAFTGAQTDRVGKFEAADGGTLFLDEVGELPAAAQVKLLRVLDSQTIERVGSTAGRKLDVRVIAATNRNLPDDVREGRFRADLYYRLAVVQVDLPALARRPEDILLLARHFLARCAKDGHTVARLDAQAESTLLSHTWPGNVRELSNAMAHALAVAPGGCIKADDLPETVRRPRETAASTDTDANRLVERYIDSLPATDSDLYSLAVKPVEAALIRLAMGRCEGNQSEAAALLGLHRNTLRKKIKELNLSDKT